VGKWSGGGRGSFSSSDEDVDDTPIAAEDIPQAILDYIAAIIPMQLL